MKKFLALTLVISLVITVFAVVGYAGEVKFKYATGQETMCFDPALHRDETQSANVFNLYDPLFYPVRGGAPIPWLVKNYTVSDDGKCYTFVLKKGVKFHDGTEMTADDVAFSMLRMLKINQGFSWLWKGIVNPEGIQVVDKYTVKFKLNKPYGPFIATLVQFHVVNKNLLMKNKKSGDWGEYGDFGMEYLQNHDAGSGPFMLENVQLGDRLTMKKFKDYFKGFKKNSPDIVNWLVVPEKATYVAMLKKGEVDMIDQWLSPENFKNLAKTKGVVVKEDPNVQLFFLQMNNKKKPLDDVNVRKAISYAFDYKVAVNDIFKGGKQAEGPVPILMPGHAKDVVVYHKNLKKAKEYLSKSKYSMKELKNMELTYVYVNSLDLERKIGLLLANNLAQIGLKVKLKGETWSRITQLAKSPETTPHFTAIFHTAKYPSPDSHTYLMYNKNAWGTYISMSWYDNPKVDELTEKARQTIDVNERYKLYEEVQRIVTEDAASLYIVNPLHRIAFRDWVKDYEYVGILGYDLEFDRLRIEK